MLGMLDNEEKVKWTDWVPSLLHAYNCKIKSAITGFCPYYLMFGQDPILPIDLEYGITKPYLREKDNGSYARKLIKRLNWAYKLAKETNEKETKRHKQYYDKRVRCMKLEINDIVLVS